jgi:hypothetical protein
VTPCLRCGRLGPTKLYGGGLLPLCADCPVAASACAEFAHDFRGTATPGKWVCLRCAMTKDSRDINAAPEPPTPAPPMDWYC